MSLTTYTTPAEVRAVLGVGATELSDTAVLLPANGLHIDLALEDIDAGVGTLFATVGAIAENTRTKQQQRYYDLVRMFASYAVGKVLVATLPLFSVKSITDGRADFERNVDYYKDLREDLDGIYITLKERVSNSYAALVAGFTPEVREAFIHVQLSPLATDPVTNNA